MSHNEAHSKPTNDLRPAADTRPQVAMHNPPSRTLGWHDEGPFGLPRSYWLLWTGLLLNRLGGSVFFLLAIYLTRERGLSPGLAGFVVSLYAAGGTIAGPVGGALADRAGRRVALLLGTACAGTLMLALGFVPATGTGVLMALASLLGFFTDLCRPPVMAAVADVVPPERRARAYGLIYWAMNLGFAGAATLGGALAEHSFRVLFVIDALTTFAFGVIVLVGVPETRPARARGRPPGGSALLAPFRDGPFMSFVAIQLLLLLAFTQVIVALPLDMRNHGLGTAQIGWLLGLNGVIIVIAQPIALRFVRGFSHAQWLAAGAALTGLGLGATAFAGGALAYALATVLWTLGEIGFSTATPSLIAELSPVERRGAYQGTYQIAWGLATTTAPVVGSQVLARAGGPALWLGCLIASLGAAILHLTITGRRTRPPPPRAPANDVLSD
jgi:MFS family permease